MAQEITILNEGEAWESLHIRRRWETWEIHQWHDGDVEISCERDEGTSSLILSQEELKKIIAFLQSKVK